MTLAGYLTYFYFNFVMKNVFIQKIYDENGILIKETYNWYAILGCTLSLIVIVGTGVYVYKYLLPPSGGENGGNAIEFFNNSPIGLIKKWNVSQDQCSKLFDIDLDELEVVLRIFQERRPNIFNQMLLESQMSEASREIIMHFIMLLTSK